MHRMRIGTRGSKLALWQAHHVADLLRAASPGMDVSVEVVKTKGDRILGVALSKIGDKGLFTKELEQALFDGRVDVCVHSMKDVPTALPEGLALAGCLIRADARDVLVAASGTTFAGLQAPGWARARSGACPSCGRCATTSTTSRFAATWTLASPRCATARSTPSCWRLPASSAWDGAPRSPRHSPSIPSCRR